MGILVFIGLTLVAYIAIDFAVYWVGVGELLSYREIVTHHLKMLPIYLIANILLSVGFIKGNIHLSPLLMFSISIFIWIMSLLVVSIVLYKTKLNITVFIGLLIVVCGVVVVNKGIGA